MNSSVQYRSNFNEGNKNLVNVYLRNYRKMAIVIQIETPIKNIHLKKIIATKLNTSQENLGIFANGERIDIASSEKVIELKDKSIIHIVQKDRTQFNKLIIYFKYGSQILKVETTPKTQIVSVIHQFIEPYFHKGEKEVFFAYTAKPINIFKTFEDELVENQCQIMILDFKPSKNNNFQAITHSQYSKHNNSTTSTKMLGMPVMGGRNINSIKNQKEKIAQLNKSKFGQTSSIKEEVDVPELQKLTDSEEKYAAPKADHQENAAPLMYQGFDPHQPAKNAPTTPKLEEKDHKKEASNKFNPEHEAQPQENPFMKEKDLLYMGHMTMQQTENFSAGAIQESKQNFLKKKSLLGKQNKMINHN